MEFSGILGLVKSGGFFIDISRYFRSVADVSRYSVLVEFSGILGLVESSRFLMVDIDGNLRLVDLSGFFRFLLRIGTVGYKTFLLAAGGSK